MKLFKLSFLIIGFILVIANVGWGQTTINFDDAAKWTAGSVALTSYATNHTYVDGLFSATGGPALRNTTATQDSYVGAFGTYSWRLTNAAADWRITISSGGVSTFSVKIRRWDNSPSPAYTLDYSTNGGTNWINVASINNTTLDNLSDWKLFAGTISSSNSNILIRLNATGSTERIMVDDFTWTGYSSGSTPPALSPDATSNTVDNNIDITFTDNATWRAAITAVKIGGTSLTTGDYTLSAGNLQLKPSNGNALLTTSGSKSVTVEATGYSTASVTQVINPGAPTKLVIKTEPTAPATNGAVLGIQPAVYIQDQFGNTTTSTATVTASVGAGSWTLGGTTSVNGVSGTVTYSGLTATSIASVTGATISFNSTGLTGITSTTFNIPAPVVLGWQISSANSLFTIDFDNTVDGVNNGQFAGTGFQTSPTSGQMNSNAWAVTGWNNGNLSFGGTQTTASTDYTRGVSTGGVSTGGMYAFTVNTNNNALGFQPGSSDWAPGTVTLKFQNKTGVQITSITVSYKVYIRNDQDRSNLFNFSHSSDDASYTSVSSLDLTSTASLDASPSWKMYVRTINITGLSVSNNNYYYLRWSGADVGGSGSRDEFALDDIQLVANSISVYPNLSGDVEEIVLNGNISISNNSAINKELILSSGKIFLGNNNLTINPTASITGGSSSSYIVTDGFGLLKRTVQNDDAFVLFPVGNSAYNPLQIKLDNASTTDVFSVKVIDAISNPGYVSGKTVTREWNISESVSGSSNATVRFQFNSGEGITDLTSGEVGHWKGSFYEILAASITGSGPYIIENTQAITSFSPFIVANQGAAPVRLKTFSYNLKPRLAVLNWITSEEENNSGFDIERKQLNGEWSKIGFVKGNGTKNTESNYLYEDRNLQSGKYQYRLKQIDYNGNYEYFNLDGEVEVGVPSKFNLSQNYPNPFNPVTKINYDLPVSGKVSLKVFDMLGKEVASVVNEYKEVGYHTISFDASKLTSGVYFYKLTAGNNSAVKKLVVLK